MSNTLDFGGKKYEVVGNRRDITPYKAMVERQVYLLKCELIRLATMRGADLSDARTIRTYQQQLDYLEELLSRYEKDQKAAI